MSECELCGKVTTDLSTTLIEGTKMSLCNSCASHGKKFRPPQSKVRTIRVKEEDQTQLAPDYKQRIITARRSKSLTTHQFADMINEKESVIAHIESGHLIPSEKVSKKIEKHLHIKLYEKNEVEFKQEQREAKPLTLADMIKPKKK
jgi:putative transcription factor